MIYANQQAYYVALQESAAESDSAYFITFMLEMILQTVSATPQVSPQVNMMLEVIHGEMTRTEIQQALDLRDRKSYRERYLKPALQAGFIEMTLPDKPNSRLQRYRLSDKTRAMNEEIILARRATRHEQQQYKEL